MAVTKIQTSAASINTGATGAFASPEAFGLGPARAIGQLGQAIGQAADLAATVKSRRDAIKATQWTTERDSAATQSMVDFLRDNESDPELDQKFREFAKKQTDEAIRDAPSTEARERLRARIANTSDSFYRTAVSKALANQETQAVTTQMNAVRASADNFRALVDQGLQDTGSTNLSRDYDLQLGEIARNYPGELGARLKVDITREFVLGAVSRDPEAAQAILDKSRGIPEGLRRQLQGEIDGASRGRDVAETISFDNAVQKQLQLMAQGKVVTPLELDDFKARYVRPGEADARFKIYLESLNRYRAVSSAVESWRGAAPGAIAEEVAALSDSTDPEFNRLIVDRGQDAMKAAQADVVGTVMGNPAIRAWAEELDPNLPVPPEFTRMVLAFQGPAPEGTPADELKYYQNLPPGERKVLSQAQAKRLAAAFTSDSPQAVGQALQLLSENYPDPEIRDIALGDVMEFDKADRKMTPAWSLLMASYNAERNEFPGWAQDFINAQNQKGVLEQNITKLKDELDSAIDADPRMIAFFGLHNDRGQSQTERSAQKSAIRAYAILLSQKMDAKAAARKAIDLTLEPFAETAIAGVHRTVEAKNPATGLKWTPGELRTIGSEAGYVKELLAHQLQPEDLDLSNFEALAGLQASGLRADRDAVKGQLELRIRASATWFPSPDGTAMELYLLDDLGFGIPLFRKTGNGGKDLIRVELRDFLGLRAREGMVARGPFKASDDVLNGENRNKTNINLINLVGGGTGRIPGSVSGTLEATRGGTF